METYPQYFSIAPYIKTIKFYILVHSKKNTDISESMTKSKLTFSDCMLTIMYFVNNFKHLLLLLSGDIEVNPGQKRSST